MQMSDQLAIQTSIKNPVVGAALGFFCGPLGLLYTSNWILALCSFVVTVPLVIITAGFGLLFTCPTNAILGYVFCKKHNDVIIAILKSMEKEKEINTTKNAA